MATDEAILMGVVKGLSPPTVRLYSFDPPAITIGRFQRLTDELRLKAEGCGLAVVRRPSGGRAVVHGNDISYSVVASVEHPLLGGSIKETYRRISERLASALSSLGVEVTFEPRGRSQKYQRSESCFETSVLYELKAGEEKIAGSAQTRQGGAFLQQGTISVGPVPIDFESIFGDGARTPESLSSLAGRPFTHRQVTESIRSSFGVKSESGVLNTFEEGALKRLLPKYESSEWNQLGESLCVIGSYEDK
jgi:lipoate-protein ligase A